jgi:hypothetical protein
MGLRGDTDCMTMIKICPAGNRTPVVQPAAQVTILQGWGRGNLNSNFTRDLKSML